MIKTLYSFAFFVVLFASISGCASENLRTQALESGATDLDNIETPLTLLAIRTSPLQANMKIRGLVLRDRATNQRKVFSFFRNAILRSKSVPYTIEGDAVIQPVILDLPTGEYDLVSVNFTFLKDPGEPSVLHDELDDNLILTVGEGPFTYAGRLNLEMEKLYLTGLLGTREYTFPLADDVRTYLTVENVKADIDYQVSANPAEDIALSIEQYPALAKVSFNTMLVR